MSEEKTRLFRNDIRSQTRWFGIIGTGQSLGCGVQAPLSKPTPDVPRALKLNDEREPLTSRYNLEEPDAPSLRLVPLAEPIHDIHPEIEPELSYPWNIAGETPHSAMASQIDAMVKQSQKGPVITVHSCVARSGEPMSRINKSGGTNAYKASMYEAEALTRLARSHHSQLAYDAIILTHGETDAGLGNTSYEEQLLTLHSDYSDDLCRITGQDQVPFIILSQQHNCPPDPEPKPSDVVQSQWRVQSRSAAIVCAGPKYQYGYHPDGLHFAGPSYERLGEKYGQVFHQLVLQKRAFVPLSPRTILSTEHTLTIDIVLNVPVPPLRWHDTLWHPHQNVHTEWARGRGFEVTDARGTLVEIVKVKIVHAPDDNNERSGRVQITLARQPQQPLTVSYAMTADKEFTNGGRPGGRVGHLCDSDPLLGASAEYIKVKAVQGEKEIVPDEIEGFQNRTLYDLVHADGDNEYVVANFDDHVHPKKAVLNKPWDGDSGTYSLYFHHDHRNFCVAFTSKVTENTTLFDRAKGA